MLVGCAGAWGVYQLKGWDVELVFVIANVVGESIGHHNIRSLGENDICTFSAELEAHTFECIGGGFGNGDARTG